MWLSSGFSPAWPLVNHPYLLVHYINIHEGSRKICFRKPRFCIHHVALTMNWCELIRILYLNKKLFYVPAGN